MIAVEPERRAQSSLCGDITCTLVRGRSVFSRLVSRSPLKLLTPKTSGIAARVVLSSFGGGLVAGDSVPVQIVVDDGAACILSTQSSSKVYRSDGRRAQQTLAAGVANDALLVVLPDPLCCYADASYQQSQRFDLAPSANLVWLDWVTSGRWARDERWAFESLVSRTDVVVDGRIRLRETLELSGDSGAPFCMGRFDCYAVLAMIGPKLQPLVAHAIKSINASPLAPEFDLLASASHVNGGAVIRIVGPRAQVVQERLRELLLPLNDLLQDDPWARKW